MTALPMRDLIAFIRDIDDATARGVGRAMVAATEMAYAGAVKAAKDNFHNTPGRTRTGQLMNAIYRGYDSKTGEGFVGVRSPYGAIQEFGGTVVPVNAKHLWVKNYEGVDSRFKRWQPKDFMAAKATDPEHFAIFRNPHTQKLVAVYKQSGAGAAQTQALFSLVDKVTLPSRPYVRPAVKAAFEKLAELISRYTAEESGK